jgi:phosphoribosylamine-glycine ligase
MGIKPWPYEAFAGEELCEGFPIWGVTQENMDDIHLAQVRASKFLGQDVFATAGPYVGCCVGRGSSIRVARQRAEKLVRGLTIPNSPLWRDDIGENLGDCLDSLKKRGYCEEWENG